MKRWAILFAAVAAMAQAPATLAVHTTIECGGAARTEVKVANGKACLDPEPFLTEKDIESAETRKGSHGNTVIFLTFRSQAAMRELQVTRRNIGKPVAILLNGRVVATPAIAAASRFLYLSDGFAPEQAAGIVAAFNKQARSK